MKFRLPKLTTLNTRGHAHLLVPLLVIVIIGGIGTYIGVKTLGNADTYKVTSSANSKCNEDSLPGQGITVCASITSANQVYAHAAFVNSHGLNSATIVLYQCAGNGSACGNIAANGKLKDKNDILTSGKAFAFGHTYKACVSFHAGTGWNLSNFCTPLASFGYGYSGIVKGSTDGQKILNVALAQEGKPYVLYAAGPNSFDCSGLVVYSVQQATGKVLYHQSEYQWANSNLYGTRVSEAQLQAGDIVFFPGSDGSAAAPDHEGIYYGKVNGQPAVVDAFDTGVPVGIHTFSQEQGGFIGAFRIP